MRARTAAQVLAVSVIASGMSMLASPSLATTFYEEGERATLDWIAERRASNGKAALSVASDLVQAARRHAERMVASGSVYHNRNLGNEVDGYRYLGENVGAGYSVDALNESFWDSDPHRHNILGPYTDVGVGMIESGGEIFVVHVFGQRDDETSAAAKKPKPKAKPKASSSSKDKQKPSKPKQPKQKPAPKQEPEPRPRPKAEPAPASGKGSASSGSGEKSSGFLIERRGRVLEA